MASRTPEIRWVKPRQSRSLETVDRLCAAAEALLNAKPFQQISVEEIAAAADSSVGGFYARFQDKRALFGCLYDRYVPELRETVSKMFDPERWQGVSLADRVHAFSKFSLPVVRSHRGLFREMLFRRPAQADVECREQDSVRNNILDGIRDLLPIRSRLWFHLTSQTPAGGIIVFLTNDCGVHAQGLCDMIYDPLHSKHALWTTKPAIGCGTLNVGF